MISTQQFRADYPEFNSSVNFPNSSINYWLALAYQMLNAGRFGSLLDTAAELFTAHNVAIEARALAESANGGIPGTQVGPLNSKSVDKVSMGYDTSSGIIEGAGHWNLTIYGTRFIKLSRTMSAGPLQIGIGSAPASSGPAWSGPDCSPSFTGFGN